MNWKGFFMEIYNLVSKESDVVQWNKSMGKVKESTNLAMAIFYFYKIYCYDEKKTLDWWKKLLREMLDFTSENEKKNGKYIREKAMEKYQNYGDKNIELAYTYIILEMVKNEK